MEEDLPPCSVLRRLVDTVGTGALCSHLLGLAASTASLTPGTWPGDSSSLRRPKLEKQQGKSTSQTPARERCVQTPTHFYTFTFQPPRLVAPETPPLCPSTVSPLSCCLRGGRDRVFLSTANSLRLAESSDHVSQLLVQGQGGEAGKGPGAGSPSLQGGHRYRSRAGFGSGPFQPLSP